MSPLSVHSTSHVQESLAVWPGINCYATGHNYIDDAANSIQPMTVPAGSMGLEIRSWSWRKL